MGASTQKKTEDYTQSARDAQAQPKRYRRPQTTPDTRVTPPPAPAPEPPQQAVEETQHLPVAEPKTTRMSDQQFGVIAFVVVAAVNALLFWVLHATPNFSALPLDVTAAPEAPAKAERVIEYRRYGR